MKVTWTKEQQKVIDLRNCNILVSAAAGSGKTAVLVERIIKMLTGDSPVDVDRLLIVTFTEAAAAEMKERIREAIEKELESHPEDVHLQRQATLIHSAQITTIHSFCLNVIREHFHVIDLDPGFRIAEEGELKLLKQDVLEELLEERYVQGEKDFLEFTEKYSSGRSDKKIEDIILKLHEYSLSYPQPEKWLEGCVCAYEMERDGTQAPAGTREGDEAVKTDSAVETDGAAGDFREPEIFSRAALLVKRYLADSERMLHMALKLCEDADGPYMYAPMLESDLEIISMVQRARDFREMGAMMEKVSWKRLSGKKDESVSEEKKEQVKAIRDRVKKQAGDLKDTYFYDSLERQMEDMRTCGVSIRVIVGLVREFAEAFAKEKRNRNLIDFSDMEQFALSVLTEEKDGALAPSVTAREYQEQFLEVMIDEYQDSNFIQEAILTSVSRMGQGQNNIFMVGDVKQSIYRFRLSRPELFMEKYDSYDTEGGACQRIDLHKNFRSRTDVLDSANFLFSQIMRKDLGGVAYDREAALYPGAEYAPQTDENGDSLCRTELLLADRDEAELPGEDEKEKEAYLIAWRIKKLLKEGKVLDKKSGAYRSIQYRDIVILTRSIKGWAKEISSILMREGIPAYAASREGYFETYEVSVLLDYLKVLDNFKQDVPLAAVLTSPIGKLNAQELADIRTAYQDVPFHEAVALAAGDSEKLQRFFKEYEHFREMVPYTPIHELLWKILEDTGYGLFMEAMPAGGQRTANLEMLVEKTSAFEKTSYKGLFHFVRYIEQLKKYDVDYGEASMEDEQADTVRIMSIHKSKGLEFPVVFVAGMGKRFNMQDVSGSLVIHPQWGVGIDAVDLEKRTKAPSFLKKVIQQETALENLGEELRVLYVAMTRAKEKLILTGTLKEAEAALEAEEEAAKTRKDGGEEIPFSALAGAKTCLDWILTAVFPKEPQNPFTVRLIGAKELSFAGETEELAEEIALSVLENWNPHHSYLPEYREKLTSQLSFVYPYEKEGKRKLKFTVSELKKREYLSEEAGEALYEEPDVVPLIPQFLKEEEELKGASRGSAYHKLLELLDFSARYDEKSLAEQIEKLRGEGKLSPEMADCIRVEDILTFLNSASGRRMSQAAVKGRLYKEQPFVLGVDAAEIYPEEFFRTETQPEEPENRGNGCQTETILVQGIIDVYFEEDDGLVVLDYKTDRVRLGRELKDKYQAQLQYYARALEQLLEKPVKEKIIYSFTLKEEIQV